MEHPWKDYLVERKVESDLKDLLKTMVAFANSARPGHVATVLIGERDDVFLPSMELYRGCGDNFGKQVLGDL